MSFETQEKWAWRLRFKLLSDKISLSTSLLFKERQNVPRNAVDFYSYYCSEFSKMSSLSWPSEAPIGTLGKNFFFSSKKKTNSKYHKNQSSRLSSRKLSNPPSETKATTLKELLTSQYPTDSSQESCFQLKEDELLVKPVKPEEKVLETSSKAKKYEVSSVRKDKDHQHFCYNKKKFKRIGDWKCRQCRNINFSFRNSCNQCRAMKANVMIKLS